MHPVCEKWRIYSSCKQYFPAAVIALCSKMPFKSLLLQTIYDDTFSTLVYCSKRNTYLHQLPLDLSLSPTFMPKSINAGQHSSFLLHVKRSLYHSCDSSSIHYDLRSVRHKLNASTFVCRIWTLQSPCGERCLWLCLFDERSERWSKALRLFANSKW